MSKFKYNPGDKIGPYNILMLERLNKSDGKHWNVLCKCPYCEKSFITILDSILSGRTQSCGCILGKDKIIDLRGRQFGKLTVLDEEPVKENGRLKWKCQCSCDNHTIVWVISSNLTKSDNPTKSCGCLQKEKARQLQYKNLVGNRYGKLTVVKELPQRKNKQILWECLCDCGNKVQTTTQFLTGGIRQSCGCLKSLGERKIQEILQKKNIFYESEKIFNDCVNPVTKGLLRFDFYLLDYNCCIEYDGKQHFTPTTGWNDKKNFEKTQYKDNIKNQYCKNNGIKLIRIPYWDYDKLNEKYLMELINGKSNSFR